MLRVAWLTISTAKDAGAIANVLVASRLHWAKNTSNRFLPWLTNLVQSKPIVRRVFGPLLPFALRAKQVNLLGTHLLKGCAVLTLLKSSHVGSPSQGAGKLQLPLLWVLLGTKFAPALLIALQTKFVVPMHRVQSQSNPILKSSKAFT